MGFSFINRGIAAPEDAKYHHGRSPAAWVTVLIAIVGFIVGTVAMVTFNWVLGAVAAGIIVLALIVGRIMQVLGLSNA